MKMVVVTQSQRVHVGRNERKYALTQVLIDTGARRSAITAEVCEILKLKPHGQREIKMGNHDCVFLPRACQAAGYLRQTCYVCERETESQAVSTVETRLADI